VPRLAEIQRDIRRAVVRGDEASLAPLLVGGRNPLKRLQIHRRQYETSLVTALLGKFPATEWLVGSPFVTETARRYVREYPPRKPCIAEYGESFPQFLSTHPAADRAPYLREFAELEWRVGHVTIAVDEPAIRPEALSAVPADRLPDAKLTLQSGLHYLGSSWPIDELLKLYLTETAPDTMEFEPAHVWIEIRGARGEFRMNRLQSGEFMFRRSIVGGRSIDDACEVALNADAGFDPGVALAALVMEGLVIAIKSEGEI
jgi:hypothetical protein